MRKDDYKVRCDISGFLVPSSQCKLRWDGLFVRRDLWEPRHPLDKAYIPKPEPRPAHPRPEGTDEFISALDVTPDDL